MNLCTAQFPLFSTVRRVEKSFVLLTLLLPDSETTDSMARYSAFLGRRVEVQYRANDIVLPASGTLVADSGRSIFLEQLLELRGQHKHFRWEIPYQYIVRIEQKPDSQMSAAAEPAPVAENPASKVGNTDRLREPEQLNARSAGAGADGASLLSTGGHPKSH
jgi:hypothetical protein